MKKLPLRKSLLLGAVLMVVLGVWSGRFQASPENPGDAGTHSPFPGADQVVGSPESSQKAVAGAQTEVLREPTSESSTRVQLAPTTLAAVQEFADLSEKILASPQEKLRRSELLMSPAYLKNLGDYLLQASVQDISAELRDQSLDFLIESLKLGSEEAVTQVERLIADSQVENDQLLLEQRKFLGETKGELLYQYASIGDQQGSEKIGRLIPGPVTQKIWNQVQQVLEANAAESQRELAELR